MTQKRRLTPRIPRDPEAPKLGRPSAVDVRERQIETILETVAAGTSLEEACKAPGMPTPSQFRAWVRKDKALTIEWHQARHDYAHSLFDKMADLTEQLATGEFGRDDTAKVTALRTAIEGYKHITSRLAPETYAEQKPGNQGVIVNIVSSLPLGPGAVPEDPVETTFKVIGKMPSDV